MWVWEVDDEVEPITCFNIKPFGVTSRYAYNAMLCSQTWIGFECIHDRCELLINGST